MSMSFRAWLPYFCGMGYFFGMIFQCLAQALLDASSGLACT
jgi:hypothetical protein